MVGNTLYGNGAFGSEERDSSANSDDTSEGAPYDGGAGTRLEKEKVFFQFLPIFTLLSKSVLLAVTVRTEVVYYWIIH